MLLTRRMWRQFLPLAVVITLLSALLFFVIQQALRFGGDDPQLQIAKDVVNALEEGQKPENLVTKGKKIDITKSLDTFLIIYDNEYNPVVSSAELNHSFTSPSEKTFEYVNKNEQARITWEVLKDIRVATVMNKYEGGYVLVGRSLAETEKRITAIGYQIFVGWFATVVLTYAAVLLVNQKKRQNKEEPEMEKGQ